ncbi:ClpP-like prohead protease/major capsid protein fusion protein [Pseudomonas sp. NPDC078700]|uniref:ClpP-like prohead protease/major capsid protein fusion protein n=1 Tax=Pseudomonas sp. NPDC078700 TaxID=3364424 RepID=UPI0037CC3612
MKNDNKRLAGKPVDIQRGISAYATQDSMPAAIALYGVIGIDFRARDLAAALAQHSKAKELDIYVHSAGGSVVEGLAMYNIFQRFEGFKRFHIDGIAASMMSVVICAADEVVMPDNTQVMIHLPRLGPNEGGMVADDLRDLADHLDEYGERMLDAYVRRTGQPRDVMLKLTREETYLTAIEALELGFADTVTTPLEMVAQINLDQPQEQLAMETIISPAAPATAIVKEPIVATNQDAPIVVSAVVPTEAEVVASVQAKEQSRRVAVTASFGGFAAVHADLLNACLLDMSVTPEQAKDKLLAKLGEGTTATATSAHVHVDNGNLVGDSVRNSIEARLGLVAAESSNQFIGMSLMELARASLSHRSIGIAGMDRNGIVGLAFTHSSSDFGNLLADVARKSMLKGLEEAEESFQKWTAKGTLSDFREASRVDLSTFPSLRVVPEGAEYKYVTVGDRGEKIMLATYGELFSITRQAVINDDLSAMTRVPQLMGRAAIRTVGDLVYAVLGNNPKMSDGKALFHADHNNKLAAAALSIARIDEAKNKMRTQKDGASVLNIRPAYLLTPVAMESTAKALLAAEYDPALVDAKVPNPVRGIVEVISDARLDEQSVNTTYMSASQSMYDTIEVAYLDGNDQPYLEQQQGFTVDGAAFKVRIDAGVAPLSWRTMVQLPGA